MAEERTVFLGRYQVLRLLGQGGMGAVYLARDPAIGREVAIKLLERIDDEEMRRRFAREARAVGRLHHPNIVTIHDMGEHGTQPFIVMEYIRGETFQQLIRRNAPLPVTRKLQLVEDLCAGVAHAHAAGIVHRDIKPSNVIVDESGVVKILDFGIAKAGETALTRSGSIPGTLNYLAPELILTGAIDHRADIFAVGAVMYELLACRQAFPGTIHDGVLRRITVDDPASLAGLCPDVDADLARVVMRALAKRPGDRYADVGAMRADVERRRRRLEAAESTVFRPRPAPTPATPPSDAAPAAIPAGPPRTDPIVPSSGVSETREQPRQIDGTVPDALSIRPPAAPVPSTATEPAERPAAFRPPGSSPTAVLSEMIGERAPREQPSAVPRSGRASPYLWAAGIAVAFTAGVFVTKYIAGRPPVVAGDPVISTREAEAPPGAIPPTPSPTPSPSATSRPSASEGGPGPGPTGSPGTSPRAGGPPPTPTDVPPTPASTPSVLPPVVVPSPGAPGRGAEGPAEPAASRALSSKTFPALGDRMTSAVDGREMVWIPPGEFQMGSPGFEANRDSDEQLHAIQISPGFWLDVTEVTNAAYRQFVLANAQWQKNRINPQMHDGEHLRDWSDTDFPNAKGNHPAVWVSWHAARAYCAWAQKRLPTEAEWEYAARAGTTTAYWWGQTFDAGRANINSQGAVGDPRRTNAWGLADMLGNAWEWTSTLYRPYPYRADDGRENPNATDTRVLRGGSWDGNPRDLRAADRDRDSPQNTSDDVGFRCAQ